MSDGKAPVAPCTGHRLQGGWWPWQSESSSPRESRRQRPSLPASVGTLSGSRLELHDGDELNCALRVEDRVDAFNNLQDLREVAFDVRSRGVGLDYQTGFLGLTWYRVALTEPYHAGAGRLETGVIERDQSRTFD